MKNKFSDYVQCLLENLHYYCCVTQSERKRVATTRDSREPENLRAGVKRPRKEDAIKGHKKRFSTTST